MRKLFTRAVCVSTPAMRAVCQSNAGLERLRSVSSVTGVALLTPRVTVDVVAPELPEPGLVARGELQSVQPLCGLPEVQVGHQKARRPAVLGGERLAPVRERDHALATH